MLRHPTDLRKRRFHTWVTRDEKQGRGRLGFQPYTNLRLRVPPRFTGGGTPAHDHELGEGLEAEELSGENPIDTGSVTTVITMKDGIFRWVATTLLSQDTGELSERPSQI